MVAGEEREEVSVEPLAVVRVMEAGNGVGDFVLSARKVFCSDAEVVPC